MNDEEIINLYWKRDESAIVETDRAHGTKLKTSAYYILRNKQDSEEAVNDTYLKAWNTIPPQKPTHLYAYLAKICRFLCFDKIDLRNAQKRNAIVVELTQEMEQCIPDRYRESELDNREIGSVINTFLHSLSREDQKLFILRYFYAWKISKLSVEFKTTKSNVTTKLYRLRGKLRELFEKEGIPI